jgi:tetrapyrrole methylase family protein/MazG family protein
MKEFDELLKIVKKLRSPGGCPWDRAQGLKNLRRYLLEEVFELIDGIERRKIDDIKEELGDIFLLLVFITEIFKEKEKFDIREVLKNINKKLISRHPHVFSRSKKFKNKKEVLEYWINNKVKKKKRRTVKDRLPLSSPALLFAEIFFKECQNLKVRDEKENKDKRIGFLLLEIKKQLKSLSDNRAKSFEKIIFSLCELASIYNIDLEYLLKKKVMREASKVVYNFKK